MYLLLLGNNEITKGRVPPERDENQYVIIVMKNYFIFFLPFDNVMERESLYFSSNPISLIIYSVVVL